MIDQSNPAQELDSKASQLLTPTPTFTVGLNSLNVLNDSVSDYQQSVGGYPVSWGYWGEFSTSLSARNVANSTSSGLLWTTYEATDPDVVAARTGSFSRYETINDSLISGSQGAVSNLAVQMDVNFDTGNVTNGALSANTPNDTWVAVFDGQIQAGDLDLQMNGASVIDSNPATASPLEMPVALLQGILWDQMQKRLLVLLGYQKMQILPIMSKEYLWLKSSSKAWPIHNRTRTG